MLALNQLDHCANQDCLAVFRTPMVYEPLMSFCPICRETIKYEAGEKQRFWDEVDYDFENDMDGPTQ